MTCKKCGTNNADTSKYCGYCGNKIEHVESIFETIKPQNETKEMENLVAGENDIIGVKQQNVDSDIEQKSTSDVQLSSNVTINNNNESSSNNKKKKTPIVPISILVLFIVVIAFVALKFGNFNNNTSGENNNSGIDESFNEINWNGVYENERGIIYIYKLNDEEISFNAQIDGTYYQGTADIKGNIAEGEIFNTYTFKLNGVNLEFSSDDTDVKSGVFVKTKNYTKEDYYKENYGDPKYLETVFNGVFEKDGTTISIYQTNEDTVSMRILSGMSLYGRNLSINGNELVYENEVFGEISKINITVTENELNIVSSSTDEDSLLNKVSGTYPKTKNYTLDDVLNNQW